MKATLKCFGAIIGAILGLFAVAMFIAAVSSLIHQTLIMSGVL